MCRPLATRAVAAFVACAFALVLADGVDPASGAGAGKTITVRNDAGFAKAVKRLKRSGGTIRLLPHRYRRLVVGPRSWRPLRIVGTRGVRVGTVRLDGTQRVSFGRVTVAPVVGDAGIEVWRSRHVTLHDLVVTAHRTAHSASILVPDSRDVTISRSTFTHCGDHDPEFVNCITLYRWSHDVVIEGNHFHDCFGCDFINGRFGSDLVIRDNRFERALPCRMGPYRCKHNDLVQLFGGRRLLVARNHFGVYREGGAQLYLTNAVDYATIINNVFVGSDPRVPGYRARMGIVIGSQRSQRMPMYAKVVNNTILTGERRRDGYAGSIRMSTRYGSVRLWQRPIVANNVIGLLETAGRVCGLSQRFIGNLVIRGRPCSSLDVAGPLELDRRGPAEPDVTGDRRCEPALRPGEGRERASASGWGPDVGAYEYRPNG